MQALFGAPPAHEDHAILAGYAALRMQEAVAQYGDCAFCSHGVALHTRVGLNSGQVVVRATTLWSYINRAQPFDEPGSLTADQGYSVTAYLLYLNGIIGGQDVMDAKTLPLVKMRNRGGLVPDPRPDVGRPVAPRKR